MMQAATKPCRCLHSRSRPPARATILSVPSARYSPACQTRLRSPHYMSWSVTHGQGPPDSWGLSYHVARGSTKHVQTSHASPQTEAACSTLLTIDRSPDPHSPNWWRCAGDVPPVLGVLRVLSRAQDLPEPRQPAVRVPFLPVDPGLAAVAEPAGGAAGRCAGPHPTRHGPAWAQLAQLSSCLYIHVGQSGPLSAVLLSEDCCDHACPSC